MADGPRYAVPYRRRRQGRTDYKLRRALVRSGKPRAVVRLTNKYVIVQVSEAHARGDAVRAAASSRELVKLGWKGSAGNLPAAYLTGILAARRAVAKGVKEAVLDIGLRGPSKGSKVFAALKGLADSGLVVPHSDDRLPPMERINGSHIAGYAKSLTGQQDVYKKRFSSYLGRGLKPEELSSHFEQVKKSVMAAPLEA
ncbi:MAG TPA: 50S ribosomal protein L18, partial [Candidatus Dormibacteraeota bacterium]|nr:50S ribosomal protein L18 [Candidatus Dormibacteraeota bacterium]